MDLNNLQKHINKLMLDQNNRSITDFEGYSPIEMHQILHFTFSPYSPIQLQKMADSDYKLIPMFNQINYLTELLVKNGELKLTDKGFLPTKIVSELYEQGFIKDQHIESKISKLYKETDAMSINLTRILVQLSGLVKKRNNKISLTKSSEKIIKNNHEFLRLIFETFASKFNWAYYDGYGNNNVGQLGYGFSLILLAKYGNEKRLDSFYAEKYFKAYPQLLDSLKPTYSTLENYSARCYSIRTFERFLDYFGLIIYDQDSKGSGSKRHVIKTDLFDKLIKCTPHNSQYSQ